MMRSGGLGLVGWVGRRTANAFEAKVDNTTIAITIKLFAFMPKIYGRVQSVATTRPRDFPMPLKQGSRLSLEGEGQIKKQWFARRRFQSRLSASARGLRDRPRPGSSIILKDLVGCGNRLLVPGEVGINTRICFLGRNRQRQDFLFKKIFEIFRHDIPPVINNLRPWVD
jgi:hypothetical protein